MVIENFVHRIKSANKNRKSHITTSKWEYFHGAAIVTASFSWCFVVICATVHSICHVEWVCVCVLGVLLHALELFSVNAKQSNLINCPSLETGECTLNNILIRFRLPCDKLEIVHFEHFEHLKVVVSFYSVIYSLSRMILFWSLTTCVFVNGKSCWQKLFECVGGDDTKKKETKAKKKK